MKVLVRPHPSLVWPLAVRWFLLFRLFKFKGFLEDLRKWKHPVFDQKINHLMTFCCFLKPRGNHWCMFHSLLTPISPLPCFSSRSSMWALAGGTFSGRARTPPPNPSLWSNRRGRQLIGDLGVEEKKRSQEEVRSHRCSRAVKLPTRPCGCG